MSDTKRLGWVDAAKGISILLVVMMYSAYSVGEDTGGIGVLHHIIAFATPFRMPEFFLISGLFLANVIGRDWARFADRRVVHYLYFYVVWAFIHIAVKVGLFAGDPVGALNEMAFAIVEPYGVLWFIYVLALVSAATKLLHMLRIPHWAAFIGAAALQIAPIHSGAYAIDQFAEYFVFFYAGYAFAPMIFKLVERAVAVPLVATGMLTFWAISNGLLVFAPSHVYAPDNFEMGYAALPGLRLALALIGALALCVLAGLLSNLRAFAWLSWLGSRSLVVYLVFALPMSVLRVLLIKVGIITDASVLSTVIFAAAVVSPLILEWLINKTGYGKFLFTRPAWAHIPGTPGSRSAPTVTRQVPAE